MPDQTYVPVARVADLAPGQTKVVEAGGRQIALVNVAGTFHAVDNECPHLGGPMGLGKLDGTDLACPWHGWRFDVTTGENIHSPQLALRCFTVKVEGDVVMLLV